jgi:hypothetical protein
MKTENRIFFLICLQLSQIQSKEINAESSSIRSLLDILATLLQYRAQLETVLPSDFIHRVWTEMVGLDMSAGTGTVCGSEHMQLVFEAATEKELYPILQDLKTITVSGQDQYHIHFCIRSPLRNLHILWDLNRNIPSSTKLFHCM